MHRSRAALTIYVGGLILFTALVGCAYWLRERRVGFLLAAFAVLAATLLAEKVFWPGPKRRGPALKDTVPIMPVPLDGELYVGDLFESGVPPVVIEVSPGIYDVTVERFTKGDDHYVAAVTFTARGAQSRSATRVRVNSETGFMALVSRPPDQVLRAATAAARDRILEENNRRLDLEPVRIGDDVVGVVCASGLGNGQYEIVRGETGIELRFVNDLDEI